MANDRYSRYGYYFVIPFFIRLYSFLDLSDGEHLSDEPHR